MSLLARGLNPEASVQIRGLYMRGFNSEVSDSNLHVRSFKPQASSQRLHIRNFRSKTSDAICSTDKLRPFFIF